MTSNSHPAVQGILETALYVQDLTRASEFYQRVFHFKIMTESDRLVALDVVGKSVLLLFKAGTTHEPLTISSGVIPGHHSAGPYHYAFAIHQTAVEEWVAYLDSLSIVIESRVTWPRGGQSIYFRDPDQNLVELITPGVWENY